MIPKTDANQSKDNNESKIIESLMEQITDDLLHDDRGVKHILRNSSHARKLTMKGEAMFSKIAAHMKKMKPAVDKEGDDKEKENFRLGWILIIRAIIQSEGTEMGLIIGGNYSDWDDFDRWTNWAHDFKFRRD